MFSKIVGAGRWIMLQKHLNQRTGQFGIIVLLPLLILLGSLVAVNWASTGQVYAAPLEDGSNTFAKLGSARLLLDHLLQKDTKAQLRRSLGRILWRLLGFHGSCWTPVVGYVDEAGHPALLGPSDPATFTVTPVNDAPVVSNIPSQEIGRASCRERV